MSHQALVSVLIPCYRAEKFLRETLDSVSQQSYDRWELIVVEDGSQDSTESIVESFRSEWPSKKVQYIRHSENRGPAAARNTAIQRAGGEFIAFIDSDDLWVPQYLESMLQVLNKKEADIVFCTCTLFDHESKAVLGKWGPSESDIQKFPEPLFLRNFIAPSGVLGKSSVFKRTPFNEVPQIQSCEDHDLWLTLLAQGKTFVWNSKVEVLYRKNHIEAATSNSERVRRADIKVMLNHLMNPRFDWKTKCHGLSQNYTLLAEDVLRMRRWDAVMAFWKAWIFNPGNKNNLRKLVQTVFELSFFSANK